MTCAQVWIGLGNTASRLFETGYAVTNWRTTRNTFFQVDPGDGREELDLPIPVVTSGGGTSPRSHSPLIQLCLCSCHTEEKLPNTLLTSPL